MGTLRIVDAAAAGMKKRGIFVTTIRNGNAPRIRLTKYRNHASMAAAGHEKPLLFGILASRTIVLEKFASRPITL